MVPVRRMALAPTPENVWPLLRERLGGSFPKWVLFWADGERSLAEIAALAALDSDEKIENARLIEHFQALAELGYVDLVEPAALITEAAIAADLRSLGVRPGMDLFVHSSMRSIGPVRGGAAAVVRAILSSIGPDGTLLAPSFNHFQARTFNPLVTPTSNGAIAEAVWRRADAQRSLHPTHSVAAIGPRAEEYLRDHLSQGVWSSQSPIGRLISAGGSILSIGVGHDRTTAYHAAEIAMSVPCLDSFGSMDRVVNREGRIEDVRGLAWRDAECPVDPAGLDTMLADKQFIGTVGRARSTLVLAAEVVSARTKQLGDRCSRCGIRPERRNVSLDRK